MSDHKLVMLCLIFGLSFVFFMLAFYRKKKTDKKADWSRIQLKDRKDKAYALPGETVSSLQSTRRTVLCNAKASAHVVLTEEWLDSLNQLVKAAYTICRNAESPQYAPSASTYQYYKMLYYRLVKAGKMLEEEEKAVGSKVLSLHHIRFGSISADERRQIMILQKELPRLQSLLNREKRRVWNQTHRLKLMIRRCGRQGSSWYWHHLLHHQRKYGW